MQFNYLKASLKTAVLITSVLLLGTSLAVAQQQINLIAGPTSITLPDGSTVPMWGYSCGGAVDVSTATCAKLNPTAAGWSPVVITIPTTDATGGLTINLTNNLPAPVPTSLVMVGQLGGGLGNSATSTPSPDHSNAQSVTWPIVDGTTTGTPPAQGPRVQSFSAEVAPGATTLLPAWANLRPGTYLIESGTHPSIQGPMGLYGILVVTTAPVVGTAGTAYPGVTYDADVPLLLSEIDPVQNNAVNTAVNTAGFSETMVWSGLAGGCGNPSSPTHNQCYPPAVNYTPLYYLINGVAFNKTSAGTSLFAASPATGVSPTGTVLVRMVNAGLRMHVPSIVGAQTGTATPVASGFSLIAEDGNPLPGTPRVQSEVFMAAGKTYDVMMNVPASTTALPIFDRELSLSGNAASRDAGMLAYVSVNGAALPAAGAIAAAKAWPDAYNSVISGQTFTVSDPGKGVIANDVNIYGVSVVAGSLTGGTLALNTNGTFTFAASAASGSFQYCGNGATSVDACTTVALGPAPTEARSDITLSDKTYTSSVATFLSIKSPGILTGDKDAAGYPLTVSPSSVAAGAVNGIGPCASPPVAPCVSVDKSGAFNAFVLGTGTYSFTYGAQSSRGTLSDSSATVTLKFPTANGPTVTVLDGNDKTTVISDYRWIIEEDRTFYIDPKCTTNPPAAGCPTAGGIVPTFGTNFHTSYMPVLATGCIGPDAAPKSCESGQTLLGASAVCDVGNGICRTDAAAQTPVDPRQVHLDPTKRYYISVLPGDAADPVSGADKGHGMGGAPIAAQQTSVTVLTQPTPLQPAKLSVFVFEDDFPLNGEQDAGGGIDILASNEPGLGGFEITLFDDAGGSGDATGQPTYDMFNMPLSNSLAGEIDPATGMDACPISKNARVGVDIGGGTASPTGITGMIVTCPRFEADGKTLSPLAGQAVIANLYPGRYGVVATPAADRIARGEEWLQTNTLDGEKAHDSFLRVGEPGYFQEYGPAGYHVSIGFANPAIINGRKTKVCGGTDPNLTGTNCTNTVTGMVTTERMSRTPDERLYSSGSNDSFAFTQCYVSLGDTDGEDFAFTKCNADGTFTLTGIPSGNWRVTVFDQWNDMLVDGLSTPVGIGPATGQTVDMGQIAMNQWQANIYTSTFFDANRNGVRDSDEAGLTLVATNIRFRDGSFSNFNNTDLSGNAGFNEIFPLFSWYVIETDSTRYKNTGTHVVYDAGGAPDGTGIGKFMANTSEAVPLPANLRVPGAVYCSNADCTGFSILNGPGSSATGSTGRIDPPWVTSEGWQGFSGQNSFLEFGKTPFAPGETGGIHGHVVYASTRPFDDPSLLLQLSWEPQVPHVTMNLYQEGTAPDGSQSLTLVDSTLTSSWDDWAQGFRSSDGVPNMNCPGQGRDTGTNADLFFFSLKKQPMWLDLYNSQHGGSAPTALPLDAQFKCYDGMHNWNQLQPAPYDGAYQFPSIAGRNPQTGAPVGGTGSVAGTNCTICVANPTDGTTPMLPAGKYVVEVVVPPGYELVKEEDKNILIGDTYIAPVTQQFAGLGNVFILPDQAAIASTYNANNPQNPTTDLGVVPRHEGDTGSVEIFWPCVGESRVVPDFISLFPQSQEVSPFAGATRNLCDRKEVTLADQTAALAKFYLFTSTHVAAHFTGVITDDFTSEFDPFSPQFGEKFSPANLPISIKDFAGNEVARTYTDQWGTYDGLNYSTWEVNPPNPTGYAPQMMVTCMNDPGNGATPDPLFNPQYSQFCYEIPFMPGQTQYMDTPVVPTSAFAGAGYNNPDCSYPDATPAIKEVDGDGIGPWVDFGAGTVASLTLTNSGSGYTSAPFNFAITQGADSTAQGRVTDLKLVSIANLTCTTSGGTSCGGYATNPTVTITGGGGSGATATAHKSGTTISFTVTKGGNSYTSRPNVVVQHTGPDTTLPTSSVVMAVDAVTLNTRGTGYTSSPFNVNILGGGGSNATASVTLGASVSQTLTITALGIVTVPNHAYSGPSATTAPYNAKTITRNYHFGTAAGTVSIGGVTVPPGNVTWGDTTITVSLAGVNVPNCSLQQQAQYGGSPAACGELVITAANGKQSIDAVTVTVGGKPPHHVLATDTIQSAIDAAAPGDLLMVDPAVHNELLLMWKPVRLQGVGAASSVINANTHPGGKLDPWRAQVNCLFGLALNGQPYSTPGNLVPLPGGGGFSPLNPFDADPAGFQCPGNMAFYKGGPNNPQVDRIPLEGIVGWDTSLNGNLAELLQEPTLMGAYEGAGITVLAKGVRYPSGVDIFGTGKDNATGSNIAHEGQMPVGTNLLSNSAADCNDYPSNFLCNPSRIDGLSITNSSQGGGGIFVHGWAHDLEIANNRVNNNSGTLTGGITVGQGESPDALLAGNNGDPVGFDQQPWTCVPGSLNADGSQNPNPPGFATNTQLPFCYDQHVNVHHNSVTSNSSIGDELFSSTPAGAGGVTFCTGSDYYLFNNNWVCGNLSTGDGGGLGHVGFIYNGDIEHNTILFNQSTNPTIPTNGGGIVIMAAAPDGSPGNGGGINECGAVTDVDCAPGLSDGTGPGLVINANLIMGNAAESGSGGGIRLQDVNGTEVGFFPDGRATTGPNGHPSHWNTVNVTNNIIANNVAGWDGAGVSLQDALEVNLINNTIISNDTTASSGVLFNTLGAPLASAPGATNQTTSSTSSAPQPAGLVTMRNSSLLRGSLPGTINCPAGHGTGTGATSTCRNFSVPLLYNDLFWQNRAFYIGVGPLGTGSQNQQHVVALYNAFTTTQAVSQPQAAATAPNGGGSVITGGTGACVSPASYWDIGVRGDTAPGNHSSGLTLTPVYSAMTDAADYPGNNNQGANPTVLSQYCNGSRTPPEFKSLGYQVPSGISDATVPNPIFNLTPAATVDEGNNWINISWGPLAETSPVSDVLLGNYSPAVGSPAIDYIPTTGEGLPTGLSVPISDFFGHQRPAPGTRIDVGAVEFQGPAATTPILTSINPASHAPGGAAFTVTLTGSNLGTTATTAVNISGTGVTHGALITVNGAGTTVTTTFTVAAGPTAIGTHSVTVTTPGGTSNAVTFTVAAAPTLTSVAPNSGSRGTSVAVTLTGTNFIPGATVAVSGNDDNAIPVDNVIVVSATQITALFTIGPNAAVIGGPRTHNVTVTTPGGTTGNVPFTVTNPGAPTLAPVNPNTGTRGNSVAVTLTGNTFTTLGTTVNVTRPGGGNNGVTASNVVVVNSTTITATFTIAANAGGGASSARNVSVTTPNGTSGNQTFTVTNPPAPTLTSVTPNAGPRGFDVDVKLAGTNFTITGGSVTVSGGGVTASPLLVDSAVNAETTLIIDPAAGLGPHNVRVVTPGGTSNPVTFTVQGPTLDSISPASGTHGTSVPVTLTGVNLFGATGVTVSGNGVNVSAVTPTESGTQVTATFTITNGAAHTARTVRVVTPNGTTPVTAVTFTVN